MKTTVTPNDLTKIVIALVLIERGTVAQQEEALKLLLQFQLTGRVQ